MVEQRSTPTSTRQLRSDIGFARGRLADSALSGGMDGPRHNMALAVLAMVAILVLMALMAALTNYIEGILSENAEQQVVSFTEQAAFTSAGRLDLLQNEMTSVQIQSDDLDEVRPLLESIKESYGLSGTWFVRADGQGISWDGESVSTQEILGDREIEPWPEYHYDYTKSFINDEGQSVRIAHKQLFIDGRFVGDYYQEVPTVLFTMPDELDMFDGSGDFMLVEAATGEVLASTVTPSETPLAVGDSIYAFLADTQFASEAYSKSAAGGDGFERRAFDAGLQGVEKLQSLIEGGECGVVRAVIDGEASYIAVAPVAGSTWYACTIIPEQNLRSQTTAVAATFQGVFAVVLLSLVGMGAALLMAYQRRIRSRNAAATIELYGALSESVEMAVNLYSPRDHETTHIVAKANGVTGCSFDDLVASPDTAGALQMSPEGADLFDLIRTGSVECLERGAFSLVKPHESVRSWVEYAVRPLEFEGRHQLLIVMQDITTEKTIQLSMKDAMDAAESANRAKSEFLSRMSHDIRTPMNVIIGMLQIADSSVENPQKLRTCLSKISVASDQLLGLINEVLDFSKIESGKMVLDRLPFSLKALVNDAADVARMQTEERRQSLTVTVESDREDCFLGDRIRLNQLLMNLLSNAVKYTPEGGSVSVSASVGAKKSGFYPITFRVADNGIGMSPEFQEHLFEPFTMEGRSREQGTGLGMSIVKNIVTLMGGVITVQSVPDEGTAFTVIVYLPSASESCDEPSDPLDSLCLDDLDMEAVLALAREIRAESVVPKDASEGMAEGGDAAADAVRGAKDAEGAATVPGGADAGAACAPHAAESDAGGKEAGTSGTPDAPEGALSPDCGSGLRILLVEDNDLNAEIAEELLVSYGFAVERAADGQEACERFSAAEEGHYDAVLMDVQMPRMDGYEATRTIRAMDRADASTVPIIAMSANAFSDDVAASLASGMNQHLSKPIQIKTLVAAVLTHVQAAR